MKGEAVSEKRKRDAALDVLKGFLILAVILHHSTAFCSHTVMRKGATDWWIAMVGSTVLHAAVPSFLMISMFLYARSAASKTKRELRASTVIRFGKILWPYAVATVIYLLMRLFVLRSRADIRLTHTSFLGMHYQTYALLQHPLQTLMLGRAYYHLYYLAVLLQAVLLFPLLFMLVRAWRPRFEIFLLAAFVAQIGVYFVEKRVRFDAPTSICLWYLPPMCVGVWLGAATEDWQLELQRRKPWIWFFAAAGLVVYAYTTYLSLSNIKFETMVFNLGHECFAVSAGLLLWLACESWAKRGLSLQPIALLGRLSLLLYLLHPLVLRALEARWQGFVPIHLLSGFSIAAPFIVAAVVLGITLVCCEVLRITRLAKLLFGQAA